MKQRLRLLKRIIPVGVGFVRLEVWVLVGFFEKL